MPSSGSASRKPGTGCEAGAGCFEAPDLSFSSYCPLSWAKKYLVGFVKDPDGIWLELYKEGERSEHPLPDAKANPIPPARLEASGGSHDVLLVDRRGYKFEPIPPSDRFYVVCVRPYRVEHVVGTDR